LGWLSGVRGTSSAGLRLGAIHFNDEKGTSVRGTRGGKTQAVGSKGEGDVAGRVRGPCKEVEGEKRGRGKGGDKASVRTLQILRHQTLWKCGEATSSGGKKRHLEIGGEGTLLEGSRERG